MAFEKSRKLATSHHPQHVVLMIDDSGSMAEGGKCQQVTEAVQDMVITMQSLTLGASISRYLLSLCKFGDFAIEMASAQTPKEMDVEKLVFDGSSGGTDMLLALKWAEGALKKSLERSRSLPNYQEELAPNPLCVFLSDAELTGEDPKPAAVALRSIPIAGGEVDVFAVGVGMRDEDFETMRKIASREEYAVRIDAGGVADFLANVGATITEGRAVNNLAAKAAKR